MVKMNRADLANYLRESAGPDCSIGLHEIGINATGDRGDVAENIMERGLRNYRGVSSYFTVAYFGKSGNEFDINSYNCYGSIIDKTIVVIAIPEYFELSDGSIAYGGVFRRRFKKDDVGHPECITDHAFPSVIPPEFILGYYTYNSHDVRPKYGQETMTVVDPYSGQRALQLVDKVVGYAYGDVEFHENPRYYNNLSQEEKDEFVRKGFKGIDFFDITDKKSVDTFYGFSHFYISPDSEDPFPTRTIKQYERSGIKKQIQLKEMIEEDNVKEKESSLKGVSKN